MRHRYFKNFKLIGAIELQGNRIKFPNGITRLAQTNLKFFRNKALENTIKAFTKDTPHKNPANGILPMATWKTSYSSNGREI